MRGARQRDEALAAVARETAEPWRYFIGLEGGIDVVHEYFSIQEVAEHNIASFGARRVFLESWAYVSDGARGYFGRSGGVELPEALAYEVLEKEIELSEAIDRFAMQQNPDRFANASGIRNAQGAWGVLSGDLISRQEAFRVAVLAAFAPFYNAKMYEAVQRSGINERATGLSQGVATNTGVN